MSNTLSGGPCLLDSLRVILLLGLKTCKVRICLHWVFKFISWSAVLCLVSQSCPALCNFMDCSPPGSSVHGDSLGKNTGGLPCPPPGNLPNPGIEPRPPALNADSLLSEPPGKLKNTGVGSLSLLQGIFPTQEPNQGLLHCKWILHQLSYQGKPI